MFIIISIVDFVDDFQFVFIYFRMRKINRKTFYLWKLWTKIDFHCEIYFEDVSRIYGFTFLISCIASHPVRYHRISNTWTLDITILFPSVSYLLYIEFNQSINTTKNSFFFQFSFRSNNILWILFLLANWIIRYTTLFLHYSFLSNDSH